MKTFFKKYWWLIAIAIVLIYGYYQGWFNKLLGMTPKDGTVCTIPSASTTIAAMPGTYLNGVCVAATTGGRFGYAANGQPVNGSAKKGTDRDTGRE